MPDPGVDTGLASCVYEGEVRHHRDRPVEHAFAFGLSMLYVDLDELPHLAGRGLPSRRRAFGAWWRREDYMAPSDRPLDDVVRDRVQEALGRRPGGPIRMLTQVRRNGYLFNPVTFYYAFAADGDRVESIVAEITNTPWKERHAYVLGARKRPDGAGETLRSRFPKTFHVSPFMDMGLTYHWRFSPPGERLTVQMENHDPRGRLFDVSLALRRSEWSSEALDLAARRHRFLTWRISAAIYWQALRLWRKRCPFYVHPDKRKTEDSTS